MTQRYTQELCRLLLGSSEAVVDDLVTVRFNVVAPPSQFDNVITRAKEVLIRLDETAREQWPAVETWVKVLPVWFIEACAPEKSHAEARAWLARWRGLSNVERDREEREKAWSLANWLYWMEPDRRTWWWVSTREQQVLVAVIEWPFPWGALSWLLRASGATSVTLAEWKS